MTPSYYSQVLFRESKVEPCTSACIHAGETPSAFFRTVWDVSVRNQRKSDVDQLWAKAQLIESNQLEVLADSSMFIGGRDMS